MAKLLTVTQAAERLGIHPTTLRSWADKGKIPVVKLPNGYRRFDPEVIRRVQIESGMQPSDQREDEE